MVLYRGDAQLIEDLEKRVLRLEAQLAKQRAILEVFANKQFWFHTHWNMNEHTFNNGGSNPQKLAEEALNGTRHESSD